MQNGWVFSSVRPPMVARRTWALKMRPRSSVARTNSASRVGGLGEAHELRLLAVGALVDGHAPAGVVLLGLADQRVLGLEQLVPDRDRVGGDATEDAAHGGKSKRSAGARTRSRPPLDLA